LAQASSIQQQTAHSLLRFLLVLSGQPLQMSLLDLEQSIPAAGTPASCYEAAEDPSSTDWDDFLYPKTMTFLGLMPPQHVRLRRLYAVYVLWVLCCQFLPVMILVLPQNDHYYAAFLMLVTAQAPLAWAFLAWYFHGSRHFRQTTVPLMRQTPIRRSWEDSDWRSDFGVIMSLNVAALITVVGWLAQKVYATSGFQQGSILVKTIFVALPITFIYRLMAPMLMCQVFAAIAQLHIAKIAEYEAEHQGERALGELFDLLTRNIDVRLGTECAWLLGFLMTVTWPCLAAAMFLALCWHRELKYVMSVWFFPCFVLHFMVQSGLTCRSAAAISDASATARLGVVEKIITRDVVFTDTQESFRVQAYLSYLTHCYNGFRVLGIPITRSLLAKLLQAVAVSVPSWALRNLL